MTLWTKGCRRPVACGRGGRGVEGGTVTAARRRACPRRLQIRTRSSTVGTPAFSFILVLTSTAWRRHTACLVAPSLMGRSGSGVGGAAVWCSRWRSTPAPPVRAPSRKRRGAPAFLVARAPPRSVRPSHPQGKNLAALPGMRVLLAPFHYHSGAVHGHGDDVRACLPPPTTQSPAPPAHTRLPLNAASGAPRRPAPSHSSPLPRPPRRSAAAAPTGDDGGRCGGR